MRPTVTTEHTDLYLADCRDVLGSLAGVDAVVTDPPYGIGERLVKGGGKNGAFSGMIGSGAELWDFKPSRECFDEMFRVSTDQIIWGGNYFDLPPCELPLCWDKVRPNQKHAGEWEYAWTSLTGRARLFRYCGNAGFVAREERVHPTQKPVALMLWCLSLLPNANTILDPFAGSGTTPVACIRTGRRCIAIEKDAKYFDIMVKRVNEAEGVGSLFDPTVTTPADLFAATA